VVREYGITCFLLARPPDLTDRTRGYLGRTLALNPDWSLVYFDDLALVYFRRDVSEDLPAYRAILPLLLHVPADTSDPAAAVAEARRAAGSAVAHTITGYALLELRSARAAIAEFDRALGIAPRHAAALQGLAMSQAALGDHAATARSLRRLVRLEPRDPRLRHNLGCALYQAEDLQGAATALQQSVRLAPDHAAAHRLLGDVALARNRPELARRHWERALSLFPSDTATRRRLARLPVR